MGLGNFFKGLFGKRKPQGVVTDFGTRNFRDLQFQNDSSLWRNDPALKDKFTMPQYPDDVQVIVHEGGHRISPYGPELFWVRITGKAGKCYKGILMNHPDKLPTLKQHQEILFIAANGGPHPTLITEKYIAERADWAIQPCDRCGNHEMFDAPSDFVKATFPQLAGQEFEMEGFTAFCNICKGVQAVTHV
jgi:hypothetical protein